VYSVEVFTYEVLDVLGYDVCKCMWKCVCVISKKYCELSVWIPDANENSDGWKQRVDTGRELRVFLYPNRCP
jgi:hypothetical protein